MPITRQDETELLTVLHEGPFEQPMWNSFLSRLRKRIGADYCGLFFRRGDAHITDSTELFVGLKGSAPLEHLYLQSLYHSDPIPYDSLRPGRVYALTEFYNPDNAAHQKYWDDFLAPSGMHFMRIVRINEPGGYNAWLLIWKKQHDFDAKHAALLSALAPHLSISLRGFAAIEKERIRSDISGETIRRLNFGWLTLDSYGRVVDADAQAEQFLVHSNAIRRTSRGHLLPCLPDADRAFSTALRKFQNNPSGRPQLLHLADDPWLSMLLMPMRNRAVAGPLTPTLIAYLHGDSETSEQRIDQLIGLFGLTRSEAGLALRLSRGRTIAQAAMEMGLTLETARNYSKKIYAKTGARGQADLVRIMLASVVALA